MSSLVVILLTGSLVAAACALLGAFVLVRKMAMMTDAISHAILPGIVAAYFLAKGPNLLAAFVGAGAAGLLTVALVETLHHSGKVTKEAAIGVVFPALFALGVLAVSRFFSDVHLDTDAVLTGNIEFAAEDLLLVGQRSLGPQALWVMGGLLVVDLVFVTLLYKELKLATFDATLAASLGFAPRLVQYLLMAMVSITAVGGFTAVGAVLVLALFIVPAATAFLLVDKFVHLIVFAVAFGVSAAVVGTLIAFAVDTSVAGAIVVVAGSFFGLALIFSPNQGLLRHRRRPTA